MSEWNDLVQTCEGEIICARHLTKKFGDEVAVSDLSFSVPKGLIFGFIGPSGSGKTTTIRMLTGTYTPTAGEAIVLGRRPSDFDRSIREKIGYMPQLFSLYPNLSVWENMNFAASLYGVSLFDRNDRINELLDFVELRKHRSKLVRDLSGGMRRRLSLAATLVQDPALIFLDEPTAGIDPVLRNKFWDQFNEIKREGKTLFITTQYVSEVTYCDLVGVMDEGKLIVVDTPAKIRYQAYGGDVVNLETEQPLRWPIIEAIENLPFVNADAKVISDHQLRLVVNKAKTAIPDLMEWCNDQDIEVHTIEEYLPPFDEVFVRLIEKEGEHE